MGLEKFASLLLEMQNMINIKMTLVSMIQKVFEEKTATHIKNVCENQQLGIKLITKTISRKFKGQGGSQKNIYIIFVCTISQL